MSIQGKTVSNTAVIQSMDITVSNTIPHQNLKVSPALA